MSQWVCRKCNEIYEGKLPPFLGVCPSDQDGHSWFKVDMLKTIILRMIDKVNAQTVD